MIKRRLASWPLRKKLLGAMMLTAVSVLIILSGFEWIDASIGFRSHIGDRLQALAEVSARNSEAALLFNDPIAAENTLSALKAQKDILSARIYTPDFKVFAQYVPTNHLTHSNELPKAFLQRSAGLYFEVNHVEVIFPIVSDGAQIGTLLIQSSKEELETLLARRLLAVLIIGLVAIGGAFSLALRLERVISKPVRDLAETASDINQSGNYAVRAPKNSSDEIGTLVDQFNAMVEGIEHRNDMLAEQLALRTEQHAFLQNVIDAVDDSILVITPDYGVLMMNKSTRLSIADNAPLASLCFQIRHGFDKPCHEMGLRCPFVEFAHKVQPFVMEIKCANPSKPLTYLEVSVSPLIDSTGKLTGLIESAKNITVRKLAEQNLLENKARFDYLAHHDFLTGFPNRLFFQEQFSRDLNQAKLLNTRVALLFIDLDRFKNVNDCYGHEVGDELLKLVAQRIGHVLRKSDFIARLGGDEFAIILGSLDSTETASKISAKIIHAMAASFLVNDYEIFIGVSIGIAIYPVDGEDLTTLTRNADGAMYQAKEHGRGNARFYISGTNEKINRLVAIEQNMRKGLDNDEFRVHYQPQISLQGDQIVSAEALLRWENPQLGRISPAEFIPVAEDSGLIVSIGDWVMRTACKQVVAWDEAGYAPITIGVNLSPRQFWQRNMMETIESCLLESGLPAHRLDIELTEGMVLKDAAEAISVMQKMRELGVMLSIDDFGTGYSSLSYLHRLPINHLKIAQEFVRDIPHDHHSVIIAKQIVMLATALNLKIIVEGVETAVQNDFFKTLHCHLAQGYYFSRPVSASDFAALLARQQSESVLPK